MLISEPSGADDIANISLLRSKIRELPTVHRVSLRALVKHLSCVASRARKNKMDVKSLAAAFGLVVFGEDEVPRGDPQKLWSKVRCARQALSLDAHLRRTM
jgi:RhoGAP domain